MIKSNTVNNEPIQALFSGPGIFCFGELLLRLSPMPDGKWIQEHNMPVYIGGAELNVATALAGWQASVKYCTALPDHSVSMDIIHDLLEKKIDTSAIHMSGNRIGIYYLQQGADLKHAGVIYDRAHSSFAELQPGMINWDEVLKDCTWFHFSAISPALNANVAAVCKEALQAAKAKGITISVDLNYRSKLWQYGQTPASVMHELVSHCQVVMGNIWAAEQLLNISSPVKDSTGKSKEELVAAAGESMRALHTVFPNITHTAYTFRLPETYFGMFQQGNTTVLSKEFAVSSVVDKAGSGDCFMAALIYGLYNQQPLQQTVDFAAAAAVGKMKEKGDATRQTIPIIQKMLATY